MPCALAQVALHLVPSFHSLPSIIQGKYTTFHKLVLLSDALTNAWEVDCGSVAMMTLQLRRLLPHCLLSLRQIPSSYYGIVFFIVIHPQVNLKLNSWISCWKTCVPIARKQAFAPCFVPAGTLYSNTGIEFYHFSLYGCNFFFLFNSGCGSFLYIPKSPLLNKEMFSRSPRKDLER